MTHTRVRSRTFYGEALRRDPTYVASALPFGLISMVLIASRFDQRLVEVALGLAASPIRTLLPQGIIGADLFWIFTNVC
jgi:hypothetical protein